MTTRQEACDTVLAVFTDEPGAIASCELDSRGRHWVIFANTRAWVVDGLIEHCLVGAGAYLVDAADGALTVLGSAQDWQDYLQDLYDREDVGNAHYVLRPDYEEGDRSALVHVHRCLECSLADANWLLRDSNRNWFTGARRALLDAQARFGSLGVDMRLEVRDDPRQAVTLQQPVARESDLLQLLRERLAARLQSGD